MADYNDRCQPTNGTCPTCLGKGRQSVLMAQRSGGLDWALTCADSFICNYRRSVKGAWIEGEFYIIVKLDGTGGAPC